MNTVITYNNQPIDFGDIEALFEIKSNYDFMSNTLDMCCDNLQSGVWTPLNPADPNYLLVIKSLVWLGMHGYTRACGFDLEFNSTGRPFQQIRKQVLTEKEKIYFSKRVVHSNNNCTFVPLNITETDTHPDMANKKAKTETAIVLMDQPKATALFESVAAEASLLSQKCAAVKVIESAEQATTFTNDAKALKEIVDKAEQIRKDAKAPFLAAGKEIDYAHGATFDIIDKVLADARNVLGAWNKKVLAEQQEADRLAANKRAEEDRKKALAQTEIGQHGVFLVDLEQTCIEEIANATTMDALAGVWYKNCAAHTDTSKFGLLSDQAQAALNRIIAFGKERETVIKAPSAVKDQTFAIIKSKAIIAARNAEKDIFDEVTSAQTKVEVVAETAKSEITQEQIMQHQQVETVATRRSPIKYRVLDITLVPADFTMTVIDEEKIKAAIKDHAEKIDANPHILAGIEFYRDETVKL